MKQVKTFLITFAFVGLTMSALYAQPYSITNTDNEITYDVYKGSNFFCSNSIQGVIDAINEDAGGMPCTIQFGIDGNVLELFGSGSSLITFSDYYSTAPWGEITITGKAISAGHGVTMVVNSGISINCKAELTGIENALFFNHGTLTISNGAILASKTVITNLSYGMLTINGGKISSLNNGIAIFNRDDGTVIISGGNVQSNLGVVYNDNNGKLTISGGTVFSTGYSSTIYNYSIGVVTISGGMVLAHNGYVVDNNGIRTVTISGGIVFAYGSEVSHIINGNYSQSNDAVIAAWNKAAGTTTYILGTSDDIYKLPANATAIWVNTEDGSGIFVANGTNTGFIPIEDVTVGNVDINSIETKLLKIYPNPTTGKLKVESGELRVESIEIYDAFGKKVDKSRANASETTMDISHLPSGVYFVKIFTEAGDVIKKVLKD